MVADSLHIQRAGASQNAQLSIHQHQVTEPATAGAQTSGAALGEAAAPGSAPGSSSKGGSNGSSSDIDLIREVYTRFSSGMDEESLLAVPQPPIDPSQSGASAAGGTTPDLLASDTLHNLLIDMLACDGQMSASTSPCSFTALPEHGASSRLVAGELDGASSLSSGTSDLPHAATFDRYHHNSFVARGAPVSDQLLAKLDGHLGTGQVDLLTVSLAVKGSRRLF